jgi:dipeptidyl aminopeptidase/acylaminoacyl peptidase
MILTTRGRVVCLLGVALILLEGQTVKRPLTHKDYDSWRSISGQQLSRDGRWLAYSYMPQEGDGELIVRDLITGKEARHSVGALPPPPIVNPAEVNPEDEPPRRNIVIRFTSDNRFVIASTFPAKAETDKAKKERKRPGEMPKGGLVIVKLADGSAVRVADIKNFQVPEKGGPWLAFLKEAKPDAPGPGESKPAAEAKPGDGADQRGRVQPAAAANGARSEFGTDLVLRDLTKGDSADRTFADVTEYSIARDGKTLLYAVSSRKAEENGVFNVTPGVDTAPAALLAGKGKYVKLAWDREQKQAAFVSSKDEPDVKPAKFRVYYWDRKSPQAAALVSAGTTGFPKALVIADKGSLAFSRDGSKLYVPAAEPGKAQPENPAGAANDEKVQLDLWHWRDDLVQPMQKIRANQERNRTYRGVFDLAAKKYVQVSDEHVPAVWLTDDGSHAIGADDHPYRRMIDYDGSYSDFYWIDSATGERKEIAKQVRGGFGFGGGGGPVAWAPDGKHALYFRDRSWHILATATRESRNVTSSLPVSFTDEEDDTPDPPNSYGQAGWTRDSKSALVYDRYDVWQVFADGSPARNLTGGAGRRNHITYRVQRIDPVDEDDGERGIDMTKPLVLRAVSEETRNSGFVRIRPGQTSIESLLWGAKNYVYAGRAKDADRLLITASRFDEFPDLYLTDSNLAAPEKVSDGGAQLAPFLWGTAETVRFKNDDGVELKATLYKPEDFNPLKKYPMIVYIYEKLSQGLHNFSNPQPGTSINIPYYVSNGYLILTPDIVYTVGYPGQSALKCVLPAIDKVVEKGFVDEKAIGIQGHSWGGYQIAYMVTQTNRFKAAEAGAPVGNMTSAYSGIRWGSGMPRQFQYEQTQSRIGLPLYRNPQRYLENSAIFYVERVKTPLLILHNDNDDAVPWYQGIELFLALRRNQKEAYLFNYNGEFHGLRRRYDQKDWTARMQQFFDYELKGAPKPEWMEKGVPYLDRDEEKERFEKALSGR